MDLSGASVRIDYSAKAYWGPRLWTIFHHLAQISERRDMAMLWNNLMRLTAASMPCEQCRVHLGAYLKSHAFVRFPKIHSVTGPMVKLRAVQEVYTLHNDVNSRLGKPLMSKEEYDAMYEKPLGEVLRIIQKNYDEVKAAWTPLIHGPVNGLAFSDWKKHLSMMIALAAGGPA
jgi:hypothetical protein